MAAIAAYDRFDERRQSCCDDIVELKTKIESPGGIEKRLGDVEDNMEKHQTFVDTLTGQLNLIKGFLLFIGASNIVEIILRLVKK